VLAGNGTWLNDKLVGKNNTILLKDNDRIGILTKKIRMDDEFTTAPSQPAFIAGNDCIVLGFVSNVSILCIFTYRHHQFERKDTSQQVNKTGPFAPNSASNQPQLHFPNG
jgi:hypothetical protein